jgi:Uma2 family endonuclease
MASASAKRRPAYDPTVYPSEDHMGEGSLQRFISEMLRPLVERHLAAKGTPAFVGANQFLYWKQFEPTKTVAPDVFVLPGVKPGIKITSWKTWETNIVPSFALEIVSQDHLKDYRSATESYDPLGVRELVIFDPEFESNLAERLRFQVWRRLPRRGLVRVEATNGDRVHSRVLGAWVRAVGEDFDSLRLRLAVGPEGARLLPTAVEEAEAERAARAKAEAEVARLRAEIERLQGKRRKR